MEDCQIIFSKQIGSEQINVLKEKFRNALNGRVDKAYFFGSFARGEAKDHSDIDLIIVKETSQVFLKRVEEFWDLYEIWTPLDIIVYTNEEFSKLTTNPSPGFWTSVKEELVEII